MPGRTLDDDDIDFIRHLRRTALDHAQTLNDTPALSGDNPIAGSFIVGDPAGAHAVIGTDANGADGFRLYDSDGTTVLIDLNISSLPAQIIGALIKTAASGKRWELSAAALDSLLAYSGNGAETSPGGVTVSVIGGGPDPFQGVVTLSSPDLGHGTAWLALTSKSSDNSLRSKGVLSVDTVDVLAASSILIPGTDLLASLTAYTPTATNFTVGNGAWLAGYKIVGKMMFLRVAFIAGTTTTYTASAFKVSLPAGVTSSANGASEMPAVFAPAAVQFLGLAHVGTSATVVDLRAPSSTTNNTLVVVDSTHPAAWTSTTSNFFSFSGWVELQ